MRVLWVSTAPIGPAGRILNITPNATSGGWIQSEYDELLKENKKIDMFFLCGSREITPGEIRKSQTKEGTAYCINLPKISFGIKPSKKFCQI